MPANFFLDEYDMKLLVTIDTEEDNWARYSATDNPVTNIQRIPDLQTLFDEFGVRPTYLVSYPVATNLQSVDILKKILKQGKCEIGMHCHSWNTPPFDAKAAITERDTMLCNLPEAVVHEKMAVLHEAIINNFGIVPVSFRAGRWGFGPAVARSLCKLGYRVDTSVTPYTSWEGYQGPSFTRYDNELFRFGPGGLDDRGPAGPVLEVPATVGFLQANFKRSAALMNLIDNSLARKLRLTGLLYRLKLLNKVWLCPELSYAESMTKLIRRLVANNHHCLNMSFHSTSLHGGLTDFVREGGEKDFLRRIGRVLDFCRDLGCECMTLSEFEKNADIPIIQ